MSVVLFSTLLGLCCQAQNDGIRGYGSFEFVELNTRNGKNYTNGGGGIIVNDNLIFGVYVSALTQPFRWDLFEESNNDESLNNTISNNEFALNTNIAHFDVGGKIGFNIAPAKSFQATLAMKFGYATINFVESYISDVDAILDNSDIETLPVKSLSITHYNYNISPQIEFQFKIGKAFKISLIGGYKWHKSTISNRDVFPDIDNLLVDNNMLGGSYGGFGFIFGNL